MMKDRLHTNPLPLQLPIGKEENFEGLIDLVEQKAYFYKNDLDDNYEVGDIPADMADEVDKSREAILEVVAEQDEEMMEKYLGGEELTIDEIKSGIRKATCKVGITPVFCGSSYRNKGIHQLLDAVVDYLPSPLDIPPIEGTDLGRSTEIIRHSDDDAPFSALAFKIMADQYVGKLCFFRVYSGTLKSGSYVFNSTSNKRERVGRILLMHANHREETDMVYSGDIAAAIGLKDTVTGDTLCDEGAPMILESMVFPDPVISIAIEPKTKAGQDKMGIALGKLSEEDPTFKAHTNPETGQTIIEGMGELHHEIIVDRLMREYRVEANVGKPQVSYKETIRSSARAEGKFIRQTGGRGQYGHCLIEVEPQTPGTGYEFVDKTVGGSIPKEYIKPVDEGVRDAMNSGALSGFPVVDVKVTLLDGSYHEVDSSELAFKIAGSMAFKDACRKADPIMLEPIVRVDVLTPEEYVGDVIGDLNSRRGQIDGMEPRGGLQNVMAHVPLSEMFGYATDLRSRTQGRGTFTMLFSNFAEVPKATLDKLNNYKYF